MVLNVHKNHKAYKEWGEGVKGGMDVGVEGDCIAFAKLSPALLLGQIGSPAK